MIKYSILSKEIMYQEHEGKNYMSGYIIFSENTTYYKYLGNYVRKHKTISIGFKNKLQKYYL